MPFLNELLTQVFNNLTTRLLETRPIGLTSGIQAVDTAIGGGFVRQQLSYLVGDSGIGKSWLVSWFMLQGAKALMDKDKVPVSGYLLTGKNVDDHIKQLVIDKVNKPPIIVFWSLEMAEFPVTVRLVTQMASETEKPIDSARLLQAKGEEGAAILQGLAPLFEGSSDLLGTTMFLEFAATSVADFRKVLDGLVMMYDIVFIGVDYFRLIDEMSLDGGRTSIQEGRSSKLREIARDYDCHVLSIFDITREGQKSEQVHKYHMKDGTAANYDADVVVTLSLAEGDDGVGIHRHLVFSVEKSRFSGAAQLDLSLNTATGHATTLRSEESSFRVGDNRREEISD
jgi:replicative DNA helicase